MIHSKVSDDSWYLVDGQQRLVTLTIIAGVVRDMLCEANEYAKAFELQEHVIGDFRAEAPYVIPERH